MLTVIYQCDDCSDCSMASQCRKNVDAKTGRKVLRDEHEAARDRHLAHMNAETSRKRYKQRLHFGETPFAVIKACFDLRRFLLRGLPGVQAEFQWACSTFNLKKLMTLMATLRAAGGDVNEKPELCGT